MDMIFQREAFSDMIEEAYPLMQKQRALIEWEEARMKGELNFPLYEQCAQAGSLISFTARVGGKLVGYAYYFLTNHPHYCETKLASNDMLYIAPDHRGPGGGFMAHCEQELKALGVDVISHAVNRNFDWSPVLASKGFVEVERTWLKWIGD